MAVVVALVFLAFVLPASDFVGRVAVPNVAHAAPQLALNAARAKRGRSKSKTSKRAKKRRSKRFKKCVWRKGKRRCRYKTRYRGHRARDSELRTTTLPKPSGHLWFYLVNLREEVQVDLYDEFGNINIESLAALDHGFRCNRTKEERAVDPRLYEMLSRIQDHFGGKRIDLVSGFRLQKNQGSRHAHASAMDIRIPEINNKELYNYAKSLDQGGMGIGLYPTSRFVHIDFRAPGSPSYRWIDYSGPKRSRRARARAKKRRARRAQLR